MGEDEAQGELEKPEYEGANVKDFVRDVVEARMPLFDTHIIVDWSARSKPSPAKPTKDAIWWAVARVDGGSASVLKPKYARTRDDALRCLVRLIADEARRDPAARVPGSFGPMAPRDRAVEQYSCFGCVEHAPRPVTAYRRYAASLRVTQALHEAARVPPMDYRDNRQRWAESHQVVHFYAGQWCTFTPALTRL